MSAADNKLTTQFKDWRSLCPEDVNEIEDVGKATRATNQLQKELTSVKSQLKGKKTDYVEITADKVSEMLKTLKDYRKELEEFETQLDVLKRWLTKVRASANPLPFALVAKGNSKGSLHVFKQEARVEREARTGKQEFSGAKIFEGECQYTGGKLVFKFDDGPRAPWKMLLQGMVNRAGVNMKVALDGPGHEEEGPQDGMAIA